MGQLEFLPACQAWVGALWGMISPPIKAGSYVGVDADTGAFALETIRRWRQRPGRFPLSKDPSPGDHGDCGGSNGPQVRLWKRELQRFAKETGLKMVVNRRCLHRPERKWNLKSHATLHSPFS